MDISHIILHLFHDSFHSLFHHCSVFCHPALHNLQHIESSWVSDRASPTREEVHQKVQKKIRHMCLKGAFVQTYPCVQMRCQVQWNSKKIFLRGLKRERKKNLFILSLGFLYVRSSLSRQLDTNFLSKGWLSCTLATDNCSKSSFGCCVSIFWPSVQTWSSAISRPEGESFLEYKEMRYSHSLWTALWTLGWMFAQGTTFQHWKLLCSDRKHPIAPFHLNTAGC